MEWPNRRAVAFPAEFSRRRAARGRGILGFSLISGLATPFRGKCVAKRPFLLDGEVKVLRVAKPCVWWFSNK